MFPEMRVRSLNGRYADRACADAGLTDGSTAGVGRAVNIANCSLAVIGAGSGVCCGVSKGFAFSCGAALGCGIAPSFPAYTHASPNQQTDDPCPVGMATVLPPWRG